MAAENHARMDGGVLQITVFFKRRQNGLVKCIFEREKEEINEQSKCKVGEEGDEEEYSGKVCKLSILI